MNCSPNNGIHLELDVLDGLDGLESFNLQKIQNVQNIQTSRHFVQIPCFSRSFYQSSICCAQRFQTAEPQAAVGILSQLDFITYKSRLVAVVGSCGEAICEKSV
ncbi:MAG: hypothetical protein IKS92_13230 [Victivallales bacterium]|nr:hypothetical protein [Victivallales bacterium]MBR4372006.1 hypothetical protein [Victivallales bacterium]